MRKILALLGGMAGTAGIILTLGAGAGMASASQIPPNFPYATSCNSAHGAPGGFGPGSPNGSVAGGTEGVPGAPHNSFGQEQGVGTGQNNSGFSESCNG